MRVSRIAIALALIALPWAAQRSWAQSSGTIESQRTLQVGRGPVSDKPPVATAACLAKGGKLLVTAGDDHLVRIWDPATGELRHRLPGHRDWVRSAVINADATRMATAGDDHQIRLWNPTTGAPLRTLPAHDQAIYALALSDDGRQLAAAGFEFTVRVYEMPDGKLLHSLEGPCSDLRAVAFKPGGRELAVAGRNGQIRVWDLSTGKVKLQLVAGVERVRALVYMPDGGRLISAGDGKSIAIWNAETGGLLGNLPSRPTKVQAMAVVGDDMIATGGSDNLVHVWNLGRMAQVSQLAGHTGSVAALSYDRESSLLVTGSFDTTVRLWRLAPDGGRPTVDAGRRPAISLLGAGQ